MGKDTFDAVLTSVPMGRTAALVTGRGEHWTPDKPVPTGLLHWDAQPLLKPYVQDAAGMAVNLTGKRFGRFTVVGMLAEGKANSGGGNRWVCKCACGRYEARKATAIKMALASLVSTEGVGYRCWYCAQWMVAKARFNKQGSRSLSDFTKSSTRTIEARTPEAIIADQIAALLNVDEPTATASARTISAEIMRCGYRIVRERVADTPGEG